jgi:hypothetical protein
MDERLKFIARLLDGEKMAELCREFGISRKTGYKILTRYDEIGLEGLTDRSRRPYRHANQLPFTAWSNAGPGGGTGRPEPHSAFPASPTTCGAPTIRASSCWPIDDIAIR